jgi:hypothetical protein
MYLVSAVSVMILSGLVFGVTSAAPNGLPQGFATWFEGVQCPTGWVEIPSSKGRVVVGAGMLFAGVFLSCVIRYLSAPHRLRGTLKDNQPFDHNRGKFHRRGSCRYSLG